MQNFLTLSARRAAGVLVTLGCASSPLLLHPAPTVQAAPIFLAEGFSGDIFYQDSAVDQIVSYDWGSDGALYYITAKNFGDGGFYRTDGGSPTTLAAANPAMYNGASVVASGDFVYYNNNDNTGAYIHRYGPVNGTPALGQISNAPNYAMAAHNGGLFITGSANFGPNEIYYTPLNPDGSFGSAPPVSLGVTGGFSGPVTFDAAGNLFYAPGFGDLSIYMWTATELANAISDPVNNALSLSGHEWLDYGADLDAYDNLSGITSMIFGPEGELWATITDFSNPSVLARFGVDGLGEYSGDYETILSTTGRLGDLRLHNGQYYLAEDDTIYLINLPVPEPGAASLALFGLGWAWSLRRRRSPV